MVRKNLRRFRDELGLSLEEASDRIGISLSYLDRIERGERNVPGIAILARAAAAYGHRIDDFRMENPPPADPNQLPAVAHRILLPESDAALIRHEIADAEREIERINKRLIDAVRKKKQHKNRG